MAALMMSGMCASGQAELDGLFGEHGGRGVRTRGVSAPAFSKARRGLSAEPFELAPAGLIVLAQSYTDSRHWHGLRLIAADGARLRVATRQGHELRADHYAFALFLPGPELTLLLFTSSARPNAVSSLHGSTRGHPEKPSPISISRTRSPDRMGLKLRALPRIGGTLIDQ